MNINYFIVRLRMLILSPIFPSLLTIILLIVYKINFEPVILCDNGSSPLLLEQLKQNMEDEIHKTYTINSDIRDFLKGISENRVATPDQRTYNINMFAYLKEMMIKSIDRTTEIEASIRRIEPAYTSGVQGLNAQILRALGENWIR